jgi:hypothetical protein
MRDSTSYADPGLKMRDTFALATVFDSEVGPATPLSGFLRQPLSTGCEFSQSNLKVSTDLGKDLGKVFKTFYNLNYSA